MTERQLRRTIETVVSPAFKLPENMFTADELNRANRAVDLLTRIKSTDHAEMVATVLFSYDELSAKSSAVKDIDILNHVLSWKRRWKDNKEFEICNTIVSLSSLGWMWTGSHCYHSGGLLWKGALTLTLSPTKICIDITLKHHPLCIKATSGISAKVAFLYFIDTLCPLRCKTGVNSCQKRYVLFQTSVFLTFSPVFLPFSASYCSRVFIVGKSGTYSAAPPFVDLKRFLRAVYCVFHAIYAFISPCASLSFWRKVWRIGVNFGVSWRKLWVANFEEISERIKLGFLQSFGHIRIDIHGRREIRMSQNILNDLDIDPCFTKTGRKCMP